MIASHVDRYQMQAALDRINETKYSGNIDFRFLENKGKKLHFRLVSKTYGHKGFRITFSGICHPSACWHAHGDFFDAVLEVEPDAVIHSAGGFRQGLIAITRDGGNWQDRNVGSQVEPLMFSESCACGILETVSEWVGRNIEAWMDLRQYLRELSADQISDLLNDKMRMCPKVLINCCSYAVLKELFEVTVTFFGTGHESMIERRIVRECPKKEVPLLIGSLITEAGKEALDRRLKGLV